jgi:hypothetical protein
MIDKVPSGTNINPLALVFLIVMSLMVLTRNRQIAVGAMLLTAAIIPLGQQLVVFGLHFHFLRLLILVGFFRVLARQDARGFKTNGLDKLFIAWALTGLLCGIIRGPGAETFGIVFNSLGIYFLIRFLMKGPEEVVDHLRLLALASVVIGACMIWEVVTRKNPFYVLGGVPEILMERGSRVRCQGPFRIPILAGTFGATLFPLMVGLWFQGDRNKRHAVLGALSCTVITVLSNSSGPLLCFMAALAGLGLWPMRERMQLFRRGALAVIIGMALVMKPPVWYLIAKVSDLVGGGGWHRSFIIDLAVKHFSEWWLIGTSRTADWIADADYPILLVDSNSMDITNHYVVQGIVGGVVMRGLFLAIIVQCFRIVGQTVHASGEQPLEPKLLWTLGVALTAHCTAFFSISYFDQIQVFWFWFLAIIASLWAIGRTRDVTQALAPSVLSGADVPPPHEVRAGNIGLHRSIG